VTDTDYVEPEYTERYQTEDRSDWPAGPWDDEPDKVVWVDPKTGLDCMARRGPLGAWCGYVGVPDGHPLHGVSHGDRDPQAEACEPGRCDRRGCSLDDACWDSRLDAKLEAHGDVNFSAACHENGDPATSVCHISDREVWWFGFDCGHAWDVAPGLSLRFDDMVYRDLPYVVGQVRGLARQLAERGEG
jgi:hypothetical protein